jgi:RNase P/RNase MRP subunit p29
VAATSKKQVLVNLANSVINAVMPNARNTPLMLNYQYRAYEPGIKGQIIDMATNSSGIRDTARVLQISKNTVIRTIKKKPSRSFTSILIIIRKPATRLRFVSNRSAWKPKSMNSGLSSAKNPINAGFGMRSIMIPMRYLHLHSALDKTRFFEIYKIT